ncbi:hypothetical protein ABDD95_19425 [Mucilaginibacter sp. PAMB04274]
MILKIGVNTKSPLDEQLPAVQWALIREYSRRFLQNGPSPANALSVY